MTDRYVGHPEINPKGPPLEWFEGRGPEGVGIEMIFPSQKLRDLGGGEVGSMLTAWSHYLGSAMIMGEEGWWKSVNEASEMPDENDLKLKTLWLEEAIRIETGFTPRQLHDRQIEILGVFHGRVDAPFPVILWSQRKQ